MSFWLDNCGCRETFAAPVEATVFFDLDVGQYAESGSALNAAPDGEGFVIPLAGQHHRKPGPDRSADFGRQVDLSTSQRLRRAGAPQPLPQRWREERLQNHHPGRPARPGRTVMAFALHRAARCKAILAVPSTKPFKTDAQAIAFPPVPASVRSPESAQGVYQRSADDSWKRSLHLPDLRWVPLAAQAAQLAICGLVVFRPNRHPLSGLSWSTDQQAPKIKPQVRSDPVGPCNVRALSASVR
jgi:hypothetical protein